MLRPYTAALSLVITACAPTGPRPYYSRDAGDWISPGGRNYSVTPPDALPSAGSLPHSLSRLRRVAESYLGVPYLFGGQSRSGMDCSGFVRQVYSEAEGVQLPHNAAAISRYGKEIAKSDLEPGDLLFFRGIFFIEHTGIYMGNGYFIHSQSGVGVNYTRLDAPYFASHLAGAKRVLSDYN